MPRKVEVNINGKKCNISNVRGVATVDGIQIPFTAYRLARIDYEWDDSTTSNIFFDHVAIRSKNGILKKYKDKDYISNILRNAAKGWWIDNNFWR